MTKKTYRAVAKMSTMLDVEFEAKNLEEAWVLAQEIGGEHFVEIDSSGDWYVCDVNEVGEELNEA